MRRLAVLLTLALVLLVPSVALADEPDYIASFGSGFDTLLGNGVNEQVRPEQEFISEYEPEVNEVVRVQLDEESGILDYITSVITNVNVIRNDFNGTTSANLIYGALPKFFIFIVVPVAVPIVFLWWGVRKAIHMLMVAFKSGRLTFGYDLNPRSYYFGTRRSDWR